MMIIIGLTEENCRLERENLSLTRSCERQISLRNERISVLEQKLEELAHERDQVNINHAFVNPCVIITERRQLNVYY